ncbi:MAG: hydrolase [Thermoanaerobaculia bacterium]
MQKLSKENAVLVVIDVQEKLARVIDRIIDVQRNIERLIRGAAVLGIPALLTEQYVKGLGPTTEIIRTAFTETHGYEPMEKLCFSSCGLEPFETKLESLNRRQILLCGIETHVCVYQTALDLLARGFEVHLVADAVSSRTAGNREIAIARMTDEGAKLTSTEMALFEMTVTSGTDEFRAISKLVK